jgi:glycosyltransferase involved in cell wall biosynthesis
MSRAAPPRLRALLEPGVVSSPATQVDIGLPTRGEAPFIEEAIDSILAQTHSVWHLFISENGPGGGRLEERIRPYLADPRIQYSPVGEPVSAAQNHTRLIQHGSSPNVAILHDDDRWDPEFLQRRVEFFENHPDCGLVFSANREMDERSTETARSRQVLAEGVHPPQEVVPLLVRHNLIGMPTVLVRRSAYEAVGPVFDEQTVFFDYEMWLRLALRFPVGYLAVWDAAYRVHDQQVTMTSKRRGLQELTLLDHIDGLLAKAPHVQPDRRWLRRRRARAHLSAALDELQEPDRRAASSHLAEAVRTYPPAAIDPKMPAALVGLTLGARGQRALQRLRYLVLRKGLRVHLRR